MSSHILDKLALIEKLYERAAELVEKPFVPEMAPYHEGEKAAYRAVLIAFGVWKPGRAGERQL